MTAYEFIHKDRKYVLFDTPGFDDTTRSDTEVLRLLASWLAMSYKKGVRLSGIIYMHRISDPRMSGSTLRNLRIFKKLLGEVSMSNVILVTSFWDTVDLNLGKEREQELIQSHYFWGGLVAKGSRVARSSADPRSALAILETFSSYDYGVVLDIQRELVEEGLALYQTQAGACLDEELQKLQQRYEQELQKMQAQMKASIIKADGGERNHEVLSGVSESKDEAEQAGNREDLKASWDTDYGSLWLNEEANKPLKWGFNIYGALKEGEFRLVELRAGERTATIEISLFVEKISNPPPYSALSYAVGQNQRQIEIKLREKRRLYDIEIGENLHTALVHLRRANHDVTLWIDAVSINQSDNQERAQQIKLMSDIFSNAANVCIWLGPAATGPTDIRSHELDLPYSNDLAMKLAKQVLDLKQLDAVVGDSDRRADFFCLTRLMASPWFTRRWCVQEVLMAKRATVHCGDYVMPWSDFVDMAQLLGTKWPEIQVTIDRLTQQKVGHAHLIGALALIDTSALILRQTSTGEIAERLLTIESLLTLLAMYEVTVSLDAVYSIYNLARDLAGTNKPRIDYGLQPRELFSDVTELIVRSSSSLNIICYPWAPLAPLPSWIPTVAKLPFKRRKNGFQYDRQHGAVLVDKPGTPQRYRACGDMSAKGHFQFIKEAKPVLRATGILGGRVKEFGGQSLNGTIPSDWLRLCDWTNVHAQNAPEAFWQTIVADQGPAATRAPKWYKRACETAVRESVTEHIDTDLLRNASTSTHVKEYLDKVQDLIWSRALAKVELSKDLVSLPSQTVCLCPRDTVVTDLVCILYGCNVPVILRPQNQHFKMIGECFLHGFMDGEAFSKMNSAPEVVFGII